MKYVIIGASAAGLATAESIRKADNAGEITILTKESYLPYSRPSISYYLKGVVGEKDMYLRKPAFYKDKKINIITDCNVTKIDTEKKVVKAGRKEYP
ncbi:MAG: NAD(P)/FAD-dependent oxidoreductase, partial [Eubacterium sp.]|nr:NAD(P)/FAD-dependent oxidoreductase [Eubacterium sp.]